MVTKISNSKKSIKKPSREKNKVWSKMAIWGFITSFLFGPLGLALSVFGLLNVKKYKLRGEGLAIAGIIIGFVMTFALFLS